CVETLGIDLDSRPRPSHGRSQGVVAQAARGYHGAVKNTASRTILAATAAACAALFASPVIAAELAQALFDRGVADMDAGRLDRACRAIEESYKLEPLPGT